MGNERDQFLDVERRCEQGIVLMLSSNELQAKWQSVRIECEG